MGTRRRLTRPRGPVRGARAPGSASPDVRPSGRLLGWPNGPAQNEITPRRRASFIEASYPNPD